MATSLASPHVINVTDLRKAARARLPDVVFDYLDGAAEKEVTLRDNVDCFRRGDVPPPAGGQAAGG